MQSYRVIDARPHVVHASEQIVEAANPEAAAREALGLDLVRSGKKADLAARVYWTPAGGSMTMVRLYIKALDR